MSAAAPSASPALARSQSTRGAQPAYRGFADLPQRANTTTSRPASSHLPSAHQHYHHQQQQQQQMRPMSRSNSTKQSTPPTAGSRPQSSSTRRSQSLDRAGAAAAAAASGAYDAPTGLPDHRPRRTPSRTARDAAAADAAAARHHAHSHSHSMQSHEQPVPNTVNGNVAATAAATLPPRRRTTITASTGEWALGKTIGAGSMGKVKLAKNLETGEQVAIKIIPRHVDDHRPGRDPERADRSKEIRAAREAAIGSILHHPYVCCIRDVVRTNYHWYMLFEYVNGGQMLDYIISHGKLKEKQARKFARQIASALDYCHRNSVVHRDLKIENILISKTGDIKIIDFGLSNLFSPRARLKTFCGSLYFAAPELLQARQYTGPEVDVWSFGVVLYVLVCGKVPFDDQSMPQLHAKIKKGATEYPQSLSSDCRHIISRMLVTDPHQRASLTEIMNHPWMTKGYDGPPDSFLPVREPLQLPLDPEIIHFMTGFDFGPPELISEQMTKIISSDDYQAAVRQMSSFHRPVGGGGGAGAGAGAVERRRGVFDFYRRRNSAASKETLITAASHDTLPIGIDPLNAYSPYMSIYYLVKEKCDRDRAREAGLLHSPMEPLPLTPAPPEVAYTSQHAFDGDSAAADAGPRTRPRARTHGDDTFGTTTAISANHQSATAPTSPAPTSVPPVSPQLLEHPKKESTAAGLLRRFSTRKVKDPRPAGRHPQHQHHHSHNVIDNLPAPQVKIQPVDDIAPPRKSFSVRGARREPPLATVHSGGSQGRHQDLLRAPRSADASHSGGLGRSVSVSSAENRARRPNLSVDRAPSPSGSDDHPASAHAGSESTHELKPNGGGGITTRRGTHAGRTKSLGHARRESIQARRARRDGYHRESNVPEETDAELSAYEGNNDDELAKPVYLKGLFSVSTTSSKPLAFIRGDIMRVLKQLGVEFKEIKGGFSCRHAPSIDLNRVVDPQPPSPDRQGMVAGSGGGGSGGHRHRLSFAGLFNPDSSANEGHARPPRRSQGPPDRSFITNSDGSDDYVQPVPGEGNKVQNDMGENLVLRFDIFIVKVPLFSLHGIQFKKVAGGMWQYREMAKTILDALKL